MRLPDFIIGGAPRSGTTWLYALLQRHPAIALASPVRPEPKFFLIDEQYDRGLDYYSRTWFSDLPRDAVVGEKSTNYLENEFVAERIHTHLPEVRLIFLLREPAERAWSNYLWTRSNDLEDLDFCSALDVEAAREAGYRDELRYARPHSYRSRGVYAQLLRPWFERFPAEQLLCVRFEEIVEAPQRLAGVVHEFLGVDQRPHDASGLEPVNATEFDGPKPPCLDELRAWYADHNRELADLLGWSHAWEGDR